MTPERWQLQNWANEARMRREPADTNNPPVQELARVEDDDPADWHVQTWVRGAAPTLVLVEITIGNGRILWRWRQAIATPAGATVHLALLTDNIVTARFLAVGAWYRAVADTPIDVVASIAPRGFRGR